MFIECSRLAFMASSLGIVSHTFQFPNNISCEDTPEKVDALSQHLCLVPPPRELVYDYLIGF
mgnify:CR=1 FL=1